MNTNSTAGAKNGRQLNGAMMKKIQTLSVIAAFTAACAFAQGPAAQSPSGIYTLAQGGGQGCGAQAYYNSPTGGTLGQSTTPAFPGFSNCITNTLAGTTTPAGLTTAYSQTAQQITLGNGTIASSSEYADANLSTASIHNSAANV